MGIEVTCVLEMAANVDPVPTFVSAGAWFLSAHKTKRTGMFLNGEIAAKPRPMQHSLSVMLVGPTGALTESSIAPSGAIFDGRKQYLTGVGYNFPNSLFP